MSTLSSRSWLWAAKGLLLGGILVAAWAIARGPLVAHGQVANALVLDLTVTLPLAYLFVLRGTSVPRLTVLPVFGFCLFYASSILPPGNSWLQTIRTWAVPLLEAGTLGVLGWTVWRARRRFHSLAREGFDPLERLRHTLELEFPSPKLGRILAFELAVVHYGLLQWRGPGRAGNTFTYHQRNAAPAILAAVLFLVLTELFGLHFLVALWSPLAAWILTAGSAYFALQVIAHLKAVLFRPIVLTEHELLLRCGLLGDARIPLTSIERIEPWGQPFPGQQGELRVAPAGKLLGPNVRLQLADSQIFHGIYGLEREGQVFFLEVDEPEQLIEAVRSRQS